MKKQILTLTTLLLAVIFIASFQACEEEPTSSETEPEIVRSPQILTISELIPPANPIPILIVLLESILSHSI